jgi:YVTN family beta-propeller protein
VLLTRDDGAGLPEPTTAVRGPALQLIDPASSTLTSTITLLDAADDVVATDDAVWAIDSTAGTVTRFDTRTLEQAKVTPGPLRAEGIGVGFDSVWTTANQPRQAAAPEDSRGRGLTVGLTALDPTTLARRDVQVREYPHSFLDDVAASEKHLWATDAANLTVERVDPRTGRVDRLQLPGVPIALASFGTDVWVAQPRALSRIDASTGRLIATAPLPFSPSAIAADVHGVWLADRKHDAVRLYDPRKRRLVRIAVGDGPLDVAAGQSSVWVVNGGDGTVTRIDPRARTVASTVETGANPVAAAVGADGVWVAVRGTSAGPLASHPRVFVFGPALLEFRGLLPGRPGERCDFGLPSRDCILVSAGAMRALDGTEATWVDAARERRVRGGSITCHGTTYNGPVTSDIRGNAGKSIVQVDGWGSAILLFDRSQAVFPGMTLTLPGGPDCAEFVGRWVGVNGRLAGLRGTWGPPVSKLPPGNFGGVELFGPPS